MSTRKITAAIALLTLPVLGHAAEIAGFTTSGYVDFSYQTNDYHAGGPAVIGNIGGHDDFSLNQVAVTLSKTPPRGFGAVINAVMGDQAGAFAAQQGNNGGTGEIALAQGYAQYAFRGLKVMGGKYFTLAGYEVFASPENSHATRSLLFNLQPLTLTGARIGYQMGDIFTVSTGAFNEITGNTRDVNDAKVMEYHAALTPAPGFNVALTHYSTSESAAGSTLPEGLTDLVLSLKGGIVTLALNADLLKFDDPVDTEAKGIALYFGLQFTDWLRVSLRGEAVKFEDNTPDDVNASEVTLTVGLGLAPEFDLLIEGRNDRVDDSDAFIKGNDRDDSGTTAVIKGIYKF